MNYVELIEGLVVQSIVSFLGVQMQYLEWLVKKSSFLLYLLCRCPVYKSLGFICLFLLRILVDTRILFCSLSAFVKAANVC